MSGKPADPRPSPSCFNPPDPAWNAQARAAGSRARHRRQRISLCVGSLTYFPTSPSSPFLFTPWPAVGFCPYFSKSPHKPGTHQAVTSQGHTGAVGAQSHEPEAEATCFSAQLLWWHRGPGRDPTALRTG